MARDPKILIEERDGRVYCTEEVGGGLLLATNWFRLIDDDWRLIHHQASPLAATSVQSAPTKPAFH